MTATLSARGKTRRVCPRCKSMTMRVVWDTDEHGVTTRRVVCECGHMATVQKMDRRVYSMFAPEDADYMRSIVTLASSIVDQDMNGNQPLVRHGLTELRQRINRMPTHLRRKLEL